MNVVQVDESLIQRRKSEERRELIEEIFENGRKAHCVALSTLKVFKQAYKAITSTGKIAARGGVKSSGKISGAFRVVGLTTLPLVLFDLVGSTIDLAVAKTAEARVHYSLQIGDAVEGITWGVVSIAETLSDFGAVAAENITWVDPLGFVAVGLSSFAYLINGKGIWDTHRFKKHMREKLGEEKLTREKFDEFVSYINKPESLIKRRLAVNPKKFKKYMNLLNEAVKENEENLVYAEQAIRAIKKRAVRKKMTHIVAMVATTISVVAFIVLMTTPAAPAAFALMGLGAVICLGRIIYNHVQSKKLIQKLKSLSQKASTSGTCEPSASDLYMRKIVQAPHIAAAFQT